MPQLRILSWNIQDLGTSQVDDASFLDMIAAVVHNYPTDVLCILETKANEGDRLGKLLKPKINAKTGKTWDHHSSTKSGPRSKKPENYVFLWETSAVTAAGSWQFPKMPPKIGFIRQHDKERWPYLGEITFNGKSIWLVAMHSTFTQCEIVECNQNLAEIPEVAAGGKKKPNVILMGDFNDAGANGRKPKRGMYSFEPLYDMSTTAAENYLCALDEKTSLKTKETVGALATLSDARSEEYDHFFWRSTGGELTNPVAKTIDLVADLLKGQYLHDHGKAVYNGWAKRKNDDEKKPANIKKRKRAKRPDWVDLPLFGPTDDVTSNAKAFEVYRDGISDHLPIHLTIDVA